MTEAAGAGDDKHPTDETLATVQRLKTTLAVLADSYERPLEHAAKLRAIRVSRRKARRRRRH